MIAVVVDGYHFGISHLVTGEQDFDGKVYINAVIPERFVKISHLLEQGGAHGALVAGQYSRRRDASHVGHAFRGSGHIFDLQGDHADIGMLRKNLCCHVERSGLDDVIVADPAHVITHDGTKDPIQALGLPDWLAIAHQPDAR